MSNPRDLLSTITGVSSTRVETRDVPESTGAAKEGPPAIDAVAVLTGLVDDLEGDLPGPERKRRIAALLADGDWVRAAAEVWTRNKAALESLLMRIGAIQGLSRERGAVTRVLRDAAKRLRREAQQAAEDNSLPLDVALESCCDDRHDLSGLKTPPGYRIRPEGVAREVRHEDGEISRYRVVSVPVIITGRLVDIDTAEVSLQVEWLHAGRWRHLVANRQTLLDAKSIVALAGVDFPVGSSNARELAAYLQAFDECNVEPLPHTRCSSHMGWQGPEGADGFAWGTTLLTGGEVPGPTNDDTMPTPASWGADTLTLKLTEHAEARAAGFHTCGTFEGWVEAYEAVRDVPGVVIAMYAALCPPLLRVIKGAPNFCIEWVGETSVGKTTTQRFAASVWGKPDERADDGVLFGWGGTRVGIERLVQAMPDLPLILDDTKSARSPKTVTDVIYMVTQGRAALRGTPTGMQQQTTARTVLISSGESPSVNANQAGGAAARMLSFWGSPFGEAPERSTVDRLRDALLDHYGLLGPRFVNFLIDRRADWGQFTEAYRRLKEEWASQLGGSAVEARASEYVALLNLAANLVHRELPVPAPTRDPFVPLAEVVRQTAHNADQPTAALVAVHAWASAHQARFDGRNSPPPDHYDAEPQSHESAPMYGGLGRWLAGDDWVEIAFDRSKLEAELRAQGFDARAVISTWRDRGWLDHEEGRWTRRRAFYNSVTHLIVVRRHAFETVMGDLSSPAG